MSNKYIEKIVLLTEKSDLENSRNIKNFAQYRKFKNFGKYVKVFMVSLAISLIYFLFYNHADDLHLRNLTMSKPKVVKILAIAKEATLISVIPGFRVGASREFLQPIYLKKISSIDSVDITNNYVQQARVLDKVIVVPKSFG